MTDKEKKKSVLQYTRLALVRLAARDGGEVFPSTLEREMLEILNGLKMGHEDVLKLSAEILLSS